MDDLYYTYLASPVGPFLLAGTEQTLHLTAFTTGRQRRRPRPGWREDAGPLSHAVRQLEAYFAGERTAFDIALDLRGTPFQREIWQALRSIPFGETRSYGQVAATIGKPGAARAVGAANAANHLPIVVPCHRVIGASGTLTGFGGGLETKARLLRHEGVSEANGQMRLI